ncbi:dipeptidase 1 isoform X1 [Nematostella vectensis]|uniref:dipeptidase 1 isoform X1 n=2 Tax=Nematostella vectensis TaxID=45351 RepID=UPI0020776434|nr:dipeptidase 1 isoform X1 [Nematostella vectensis]
MNRKKLLIGIAVVVVLVIVVAVPCAVLLNKKKDEEKTYEQRVAAILADTPLIDGHNDIPWQMRKYYMNRLENITLDTGSPELHTDIPRLRKGKVGGQFWSAFVSCSNQYKNSVRLFVEQIDVIHRLAAKYQKDLEFVTTAQGILDAYKAGKIASLVGIEGGHAIDSSLDTLRMMYEMGGRYMTLTHGCHTPWADSCSPAVPLNNGLSDFGKDVIREMNRLGMFVDISHVTTKTMHDVLDISKAPVIFSHSSAFAICNTSRNVPDDVLKRMPTNGGVVMVNFYNNFVTCKKEATLSDVADHFDHIKKIAGVDYIGFGADYDGVSRVPTGLEDVSKYPDLMVELLKRGYSDQDLAKIAGGNLIRAMKKMEQVAKELQTSVKPYDSFIVVNKTCRPNYYKDVF